MFCAAFVEQPWNTAEKAAIERYFGGLLLKFELPAKEAIESCMKTEHELRGRTWRLVKDYCHIRIATIKRCMKD